MFNGRGGGIEAYESLRDDLTSGLFRAGEPLGEGDLAARLGVSRTPVREALRRLEADGLVVVVPVRGAFVREITPRDIREVFELREAIEGHAISAAGDAVDREALEALHEGYALAGDLEPPEVYRYTAETELHRLILEALGNRRAIDDLRRHGHLVVRLRALLWRRADRRLDAAFAARHREVAGEHAEIATALLGGELEVAREAMALHLRRGCDHLLRHLAEADLTAPPRRARAGDPA